VKALPRLKATVFIMILLALSFFSPAFSKPDEIQKIVIESGSVERDAVTLSFRLSNPYSPELMEVIKSGIEVRFEYEIVIKRVHKNWFNVTVGGGIILKKIKYDPLSNEFVVSSDPLEGKKFFKDLEVATMDFFSFQNLHLPLSKFSVRGKRYEISVRAQLDELDVAGIFKYIPFVSNWFKVKTDWTRLRVNAR
jgi:hypothetical protein